MPSYLRTWYLQKLIDTRQKENEAQEKAMNKNKGPKISRPSFAKPNR